MVRYMGDSSVIGDGLFPAMTEIKPKHVFVMFMRKNAGEFGSIQ